MSDTGFFGSTLTQVYNFNGETLVFPEEMRGIGPRTYVVGDGIEETSVPFNTNVTDSQILIDYNVTPPNVNRWNGMIWSGPRWSDLTDNVAPILFVDLETNMVGLGAEDLRWEEDSIWLNWNGLSFNPDTYVTLTVTFAEEVIDGGSGDDRISGGDGADLVRGGDGHDHLVGGDGSDWLQGGNGDDRLIGGDGNDRLTGGAGDDRLQGGDGDDRLQGGSGDDLMIGGEGADIFLFGAEAGHDTIRGFDATLDQLVFTDGVTLAAAEDLGADTLLTLSSGATILLVGVDFMI